MIGCLTYNDLMISHGKRATASEMEQCSYKRSSC